jgi:hypothetical protein
MNAQVSAGRAEADGSRAEHADRLSSSRRGLGDDRSNVGTGNHVGQYWPSPVTAGARNPPAARGRGSTEVPSVRLADERGTPLWTISFVGSGQVSTAVSRFGSTWPARSRRQGDPQAEPSVSVVRNAIERLSGAQ